MKYNVNGSLWICSLCTKIEGDILSRRSILDCLLDMTSVPDPCLTVGELRYFPLLNKANIDVEVCNTTMIETLPKL